MKGACESFRIAESKRQSESGWTLSRRGLLAGIGFGALGVLSPSALSQVVLSPKAKEFEGDVIVSVFLRGGMDGMSAVVPYAEDAYHRARPNLRIGNPKDGSVAESARALDLDGFFGLHPSLAPLLPLYQSGQLGIVHAVGSGDQTRSHFEAMNAMERGMYQVRGGEQTGWVARHLASTPRKTESPLRAVSISSTLPDSLRGASHAMALENLADFRLAEPEMRDALESMYGSGKDAMSTAGRETLEVLQKLRGLKFAGKSNYPNSDLAKGLQQVSTLIRSGVGLEIACLEMGGWDTHVAQGTTSGWLPNYLADLGRALAAFVADMGPDMKCLTVVVQTEFGRRLEENTGLGTDHGRASAMFLLGGNVVGGKVHAQWPGLEKSQLDEVGDLRVTTDYRDVLGEVLAKRLPGSLATEVFPGWSPGRTGFVR
jgi:uncharacterized protein (DUF1501 family)